MTSKKLANNELLADPGFSLGEGNVTMNELATAICIIKNLIRCLAMDEMLSDSKIINTQKIKQYFFNSRFVRLRLSDWFRKDGEGFTGLEGITIILT